MKNNFTGARANGVSLKTAKLGDEIVCYAQCATCDNRSVYHYTDIYTLMSDMSSDSYFYGKWHFSDSKTNKTIRALCPSCAR